VYDKGKKIPVTTITLGEALGFGKKSIGNTASREKADTQSQETPSGNHPAAPFFELFYQIDQANGKADYEPWWRTYKYEPKPSIDEKTLRQRRKDVTPEQIEAATAFMENLRRNGPTGICAGA